MTSLNRTNRDDRLPPAVARTISRCGSPRLWFVPVSLILWALVGCGAGQSGMPGNGPSVTTPAREPLPTVPEQSEPDLTETTEPAGTEPTNEATATNEAANEPAEKLPNETEGGNELELQTDSSQPLDGGESSRYEFRDEHDPNGIGKFYMGREIAHVMGFQAANWLERTDREKEEGTSKLIKALALEEGMIVADIGAGSGVLTLPIAGRVGRKGKVFAVDVQQEMLDRLAGKLKVRRIENVVLVQGTDKTPRLDEATVDLALMVDVYHEFAFPYEMLLEISKAMKPGGRVVFVEFRMEDPNVPIKLVHKMTQAQVKKEVDFPEFRLKWKETIGTLPWQHVIVFEKQAKPSGDLP